jgi:YD repeat-containing protein
MRTNNFSGRKILPFAPSPPDAGDGGWALTETLIAIAIGFTFLVAFMAIFITSTLSFAGVGNYINMDRRSRNALDKMTRSIRNAKVLTSFDPAALVFNYDTAGKTNLAYRYNASSRSVTEEWTVGGASTTNTLLTGCDSLAFSLYDHAFAPTTDVSAGQGKVISIAWQCSGTSITRTNTEHMQQAQIVIRNQP